jgi:hypothetical protein
LTASQPGSAVARAVRPGYQAAHLAQNRLICACYRYGNLSAGHADILREQLDGRVGESKQGSAAFQEYDADYWASKQAKIEQAAIAADPAQA